MDELESRAARMYAADVRNTRLGRVVTWERLGAGDWLENEIRKAYLRAAEREQESTQQISVTR